jgi:DNA-binding GntR family transcriptional regulator
VKGKKKTMKESREFLQIDVSSYKPLREVVFETLRNAIINGDLTPGQRLMEVQLAEEMGVSRTPIREAIRKLELENLVVMIPRKGAYVATMSKEDVKEILDIRAVLEALAAELAAKNADYKDINELKHCVELFTEAVNNNDVDKIIEYDVHLHDTIYHAAQNKKLINIINSLREQVQRFRSAYLVQVEEREDLLNDHTEMIQAIESKDPSWAHDAAYQHIKNTEKNILNALE